MQTSRGWALEPRFHSSSQVQGKLFSLSALAFLIYTRDDKNIWIPKGWRLSELPHVRHVKPCHESDLSYYTVYSVLTYGSWSARTLSGSKNPNKTDIIKLYGSGSSNWGQTRLGSTTTPVVLQVKWIVGELGCTDWLYLLVQPWVRIRAAWLGFAAASASKCWEWRQVLSG